MYSPDVKIIREVVKPSGETEQIIIPSQRFFKELKLGQKTAKIKNYKNKYKNIIVKEIPNGLQVSAERQPSNETYWLKMYQILQNTDSGMKITEEKANWAYRVGGQESYQDQREVLPLW